MLPMGSIFFPLIVALFKTSFLNMETDSKVQELVYRYRQKCIKILRIFFPFIAYCLTEFKTVFPYLILVIFAFTAISAK